MPGMNQQIGICGEEYFLTADQIEFFKQNGYAHLPGVLTEEELKQLDTVYEQFIHGNVTEAAKATSDMTGAPTGKSIEDYQGIVVVNPSKYNKEMSEHIFKKRANHIASQLEGGIPMGQDMDRILAKKPKAPKAEFKWHQDDIYLSGPDGKPADFPKYQTLMLFVELDDTSEKNGCIHYVSGSHKEERIRPHVLSYPNVQPTTITVSETAVDETTENCVSVHAKRGDMVLHTDRTLHRSGGNRSDDWRRTYVIHFCPQSIIDMRETMGISSKLVEH